MQQQIDDLQQWQHKKKLVLVLALTFLINYSIRWLDGNSAAHSIAAHKLATAAPVSIDDLLQILEFEEIYEGTWTAPQPQGGFLAARKGVFDMRVARLMETRSQSYFELSLRVFDGLYADDGSLELQFRCAKGDFENSLLNGTHQAISLKNGSSLDGRFSQEHLLATVRSGPANISHLSFSLSVEAQQGLSIKVGLESEEAVLGLVLSRDSGRIGKLMVLAGIMFVACFETFSGLFTVVREASEGGAGRYSLATVCLASMWDTVVCMALLVLAFSSQFYVRCFPYNVFRLRPDYTLGLCCLFLLAVQYALLYAQKLYGPKKVVPRFLLPARYDYAYEEEANVEEDALTAECAICLTPLHAEPPQGASPAEVEGRVMRTPCQHRYHSACLAEWMRIKQSCPECRAHLPPYE